eukprot:scaffold1090_cov265-Pinguiococcus_pyrenoidosus.AAC.32
MAPLSRCRSDAATDTTLWPDRDKMPASTPSMRRILRSIARRRARSSWSGPSFGLMPRAAVRTAVICASMLRYSVSLYSHDSSSGIDRRLEDGAGDVGSAAALPSDAAAANTFRHVRRFCKSRPRRHSRCVCSRRCRGCSDAAALLLSSTARTPPGSALA